MGCFLLFFASIFGEIEVKIDGHPALGVTLYHEKEG